MLYAKWFQNLGRRIVLFRLLVAHLQPLNRTISFFKYYIFCLRRLIAKTFHKRVYSRIRKMIRKITRSKITRMSVSELPEQFSWYKCLLKGEIYLFIGNRSIPGVPNGALALLGACVNEWRSWRWHICGCGARQAMHRLYEAVASSPRGFGQPGVLLASINYARFCIYTENQATDPTVGNWYLLSANEQQY